MMRVLIATALLAVSTPVFAQDPEAARLQASRTVVELVLPPAQRNEIADAMIKPMMANMQQALLAAPQFAEIKRTNPRFEAAVGAMLADEQQRAIVNTREAMPLLASAMERAYARRFSTAELAEIAAFLRTPTGSRYLRESMTMMSDPDIAAAQRAMMAKGMEGLQERVAKFVADLTQEGAAE